VDSSSLRWVESNGGPLLLLPEMLLPSWTGSDEPPVWRNIKAKFRFNPDGRATDYDRACDVHDFVGVIEVGDGTGLVLGDEPLATTWWPSIDGGFLVRWDFGDSDEAVRAHLARLESAGPWEPGPTFECSRGPLILFDSADPGLDPLNERLTIELKPGKYLLGTCHHKPDSQTSLRLHRLTAAT
jgi:hypothetical protein